MKHKAKINSGKKAFLLLLFLILHFTFNIEKCLSQVWTPLGSGFVGTYCDIRALTVYNNELIAGGFTNTGDSAKYIAKWNGSNWVPLGSGLNNFVYAFTLFNNELIAGGKFTTAGGLSVNNIAKWNGTTWAPLGSGISGASNTVYTLTIYNNELIVGGSFTTAGGVNTNCIAKWDGTSWTPLGSGMSGAYSNVRALTVYNNELIAGGSFTTAGGVNANHIAKWNGTSWSPLGNGISGALPYVLSLTVHNNELIVGGNLDYAGGLWVNDIAKWNGTSWSPYGTGMNDNVSALYVFNGELITGGKFTTAGGVNANRIAKWNGTIFLPFGSGMSGAGYGSTQVLALTEYNNELIAGGIFTYAGGVTCNNIAKWTLPTRIAPTTGETPKMYSLSQNYPNPFNPTTNIKYQIPKNSFVTLKVYDVTGEEVKTLVNETKSSGNYYVDFNGSDLTSGVYFYKIQAGDFSETKKMLLVK